MTDIRRELSATEVQNFKSRALELAAEARRIIKTALASGFDVKRKPDGSFVTSVDLRVEERLRELIRTRFPAHGVIGEERPPSNPGADFQWIIDPVDGTEDLVHRVPVFGTIIGLHYHGQPIVGVIDIPMLDICVSGAFGLGAFQNNERILLGDLPSALPGEGARIMLGARANFTRYGDDGRLFDAVTRAYPNHRIYRSCYAHACAVTGAADATVDYGNRIWDLAASRILVEEAGGKYVVIQDADIPGTGRVYGAVFGKPALVGRLAALLRRLKAGETAE